MPITETDMMEPKLGGVSGSTLILEISLPEKLWS